MPLPPAEPARAARDARRHAACRVTSAEPLVGRGKRRAACPLRAWWRLAGEPLGR